MASTTGSSDPGPSPGSAHRHQDGEANPGPQVGSPEDQPRADSNLGPADTDVTGSDVEADGEEGTGGANPGPPKEPILPA